MGKPCLGSISDTLRYLKFIRSGDIGLGVQICHHDLDLTFDLAVMTLSFKTMSGL